MVHQILVTDCITQGEEITIAMPDDVRLHRGDIVRVAHATGHGRYRVGAVMDPSPGARGFAHAAYMGMAGDRPVGYRPTRWERVKAWLGVSE